MFDITPAFIFRGINEKEQWGVRLQADTSITDDINVLWGADYTDESVEQPFELFDVETFDRSGEQTLRKTGEITSIPEYEFTSFGLFAQLQWDVSEDFSLSGGVRQEKLGLNVDDYTLTAFEDSPRDIKGGGLNFSDTIFNVGAVYDITDNFNIYASFSQGFSAPDFGRFLRSPPEGFQAIESDLEITKPQKVDNYELGIRGNWSSVQASLVGFFNNSDRGVEVVPRQEGEINSSIRRVDERIYGIEASVDWQPADKWNVGSTFTWSEGDQEADDGDFEPLRSRRISPIKVTAYVQNETLPGWNNRLQMLYVGNRDRAFDEGRDPVPIESYITVDLISSIKLGGGTLQLGIENLFDEQYTTVTNQFSGGSTESRNVAARGRRISVEYSLSW
jgi:iron complex outermembrane receptor protein